MLSEAARSAALEETPETMRELRELHDLDPDAYREMFRPLLPVDALPSDALSDRQLEVNCDAMLEGLARIARRTEGTLH